MQYHHNSLLVDIYIKKKKKKDNLFYGPSSLASGKEASYDAANSTVFSKAKKHHEGRRLGLTGGAQ